MDILLIISYHKGRWKCALIFELYNLIFSVKIITYI